MTSILRRSLLGIVIALAFGYVSDDLVIRYRIRNGSNPYRQVTVHRLDAIPQKNNRIEYIPEEPILETCIHSLFPHIGYLPCWYLSRKTEQRVNY